MPYNKQDIMRRRDLRRSQELSSRLKEQPADRKGGRVSEYRRSKCDIGSREHGARKDHGP